MQLYMWERVEDSENGLNGYKKYLVYHEPKIPHV